MLWLIKLCKTSLMCFVVEAAFGVLPVPSVAAGDAGEARAVVTVTEHVVTTDDNWEISIRRYRVKDGGDRKAKAAVILCHGFNFNNLFWDIDKEVSLPRYLAENGYDVWAPSLRGSGLSSKPLISGLRELTKLDVKNIPRAVAKAPSDITKVNWTIDDHIYEDAPAVIGYVKEKSGFDKVYWIGHSMGGIIMYAYLETVGQDDIAGFIPIGSMMVIPRPLSPHLKTIAEQEQLMTASLIINTRAAADIRNLTLGAVKHPMEDLLLRRENVNEDVLFKLFRECIDDTAPGVVKQFSRSIRNGGILSSASGGREYNYTEKLNLIRVPVFLMAGGADAFVTECSLKDCYRALSSRDKRMEIFSEENAYSADYGHSDVVIGKRSKEEVYPVILRWLDRRTAARGPVSIINNLINELIYLFRRILW